MTDSDSAVTAVQRILAHRLADIAASPGGRILLETPGFAEYVKGMQDIIRRLEQRHLAD